MGVFFLLCLVYCLQALALVCNGSEELCEKRVDQVSFATAHNAMASAQGGFIPPDHISGLKKQFHDGIRAFSIDLHPYKHTIYLCHSYCTLGKRPLFDWLLELRILLDFKPNDTVILVFESYADPKEIQSIFDQAGLAPYMHTQDPAQEWPTLGELAISGRRIVIFTNQVEKEKPTWQNNETDFLRATDWNVNSINNFECKLLNGEARNNSIYRLYNIVLNPFANQKNSKKANSNPFLIERAKKCQKEWGHIPNLVEVTFYSEGNLFEVVDSLNSED